MAVVGHGLQLAVIAVLARPGEYVGTPGTSTVSEDLLI